MEQHLIPVNDLSEHDLSEDCKCKPDIEVVEGSYLITHRAYDGREYQEFFGVPSKGWEIWGTKLLETE